MARRLKRTEYEKHIPHEPGINRVNHVADDCSGDSASLRITKSADGSVAARCYRCGAWDTQATGGFYKRPSPRDFAAELAESEDGYRLPADLDDPPWPLEVTAWLGKAGVTAAAAAQRGTRWSPSREALYIPVEQAGSAFGPKLVGYVVRKFNPKDYRTLTKTPRDFWGLYSAAEPSGTLVLVESVVDAWRVSAAGYDALALLTTSLAPGALARIVQERYRRVVVFLDNDHPRVQTAARELAKVLSFLPIHIVQERGDPKLQSDERLRALIGEK